MRSLAERAAAARRRLATDANIWVATASMDGRPHLVPLSLAWIDGAVVVATPTNTPTVRNAAESGKARASLDSAEDVVIIDAEVDVRNIDEVEPETVAAYVARVGWDPREQQDEEWSLLFLSPRRVQSWSGVGEIGSRTICRDGRWFA